MKLWLKRGGGGEICELLMMFVMGVVGLGKDLLF